MIDVSLFRPLLRGRCHAEAGAERAGLPGGRPGTYGPAMSLTPEEIERYARHLVLADIGGPGQAKLKAARVLCIGAGGLGAPLLQYLARAGVGHIGIVDFDSIDISNLHRQVLYDFQDAGKNKAEVAAAKLRAANPFIETVAYPVLFDYVSGKELAKNYD